MKRRVKRLLFAGIGLALTGILAACWSGAYDSIFVETRTITSGSFGNFSIGESKPQALVSVSKTDPTTMINPIPVEDFIISEKNLSEISDVKTTSGVSLFNYHGTSVIIYFENGKVYKIDRSYNNKFPQFKAGDTISNTADKLLGVLKSNRGFFVVPAVDYDGTRSYDVRAVLKDADSKLFKYDAWEFEVAKVRPAGAFYTLYFSNRKLCRIKYRRPRIRNDL